MASRGFEFDSMLDRSGATPRVFAFVLGVAADHLIGDLMAVQSDGFIDATTASIGEVTCVMAEQIDTADITAETTTGKAWVLTRNQVWRCSTDATTAATALVGFTKTWDIADKNTIDADDITNGSMIVLERTQTDDEGNILGLVVFDDCTFNNA